MTGAGGGVGLRAWRAHAAPIFAVVFVGLLSIGFWADGCAGIAQHEIESGDQNHWLTMAATLSRHGVLSRDGVEPAPGTRPAPTSYREPLYPALLALQISRHPALSHMTVPEVLRGSLGAPGLESLQGAQVALHFATALLVAWIFWRLTGSVLGAALVFPLVAFSPTLAAEARLYRNEGLAAFLLTAASAALLLAVERPSPLRFAGAGLAVGLLALTKAMFATIWLPVLLLGAWAGLRRGWGRRRTVVALAAFAFAFTTTLGPWMARNLHHFGHAHLTQRGGAVLYLRALYDGMNRDEYWASFVRFSDFEWTERVGDRIPFESKRHLLRWEDGSFYEIFKERRTKLADRLGSVREADRALLAEAVGIILAHPVRHLLVSIPLGLRGVFVEEDLAWLSPGVSGALTSVILFGALSGWAVLAFWRGDHALAAVLLPALFAWAFHTLLTHNIPRYNAICIPILYLCAALSAAAAWRWIEGVVARRPAAEV